MARSNRAFITAVARRAALTGVAAFLDLGAGLPVHPCVHEAAREVDPDAKVVYVDIDPVVVRHAQALLGGSGIVAVEADLRDTEAVRDVPGVAALLSTGEPLCVIFGGVLHFLPPDEAAEIIARYRAILPVGSWIAISILHYDDKDLLATMTSMYTAAQFVNHGTAELAQWLDGMELVPPGITETQRWAAGIVGPPPSQAGWIACGVAIKR
jgi:O-methyltransferase involved in polyketide biosynthesis